MSRNHTDLLARKIILTIYLLRLILSRFDTLSSLNTEKSLATNAFRQPRGQCGILLVIVVLGSSRWITRGWVEMTISGLYFTTNIVYNSVPNLKVIHRTVWYPMNHFCLQQGWSLKMTSPQRHSTLKVVASRRWRIYRSIPLRFKREGT